MEVEKPNTSESLLPDMEEEKEGLFTSEFERLRRILPEEIWKLVAGKMSSEDVENLANSSAFFRNLLASMRTTYLFEKVFPLVASSVWKSEGLEGLPVAEVLKLRGVCSHWNSVIDKLIPEQFQHFGKGSPENEEVTWRIAFAFEEVVGPTRFLVPERRGVTGRTRDFIHHFERTHPGYPSKGRNPFIWGNIGLIISGFDVDQDDYEVHQRNLRDISTALSKYGRYVHKLHLQLTGFQDTSMLQEWFLNLSNLKELSFHGEELRENDLRPEWGFPKLEHLETLHAGNLPGVLFNRLVREASQVSSLSVRFGFEEDDYSDYDFFTFPLPNLRKLKLKCCKVVDVEKFRSLQVQWPLESLKLDYSWDSGGSTNFQVIQDKFASTLVSLDLEIRRREDKESELWQDCKNWRLELPNLKKIKLDMDESVGLDFLLPMRNNLEEIWVQVGYRLPLQQVTLTGTIVQFMGFEGKMLVSNIWTIFKKLNKIKVSAIWEDHRRHTRSYSREEWMKNNAYN